MMIPNENQLRARLWLWVLAVAALAFPLFCLSACLRSLSMAAVVLLVAVLLLYQSVTLYRLGRTAGAVREQFQQQREQLVISQERFRLTFENTQNALFEYDLAEGQYLEFINAEKLFGKTLEQLNAEAAEQPPQPDETPFDTVAHLLLNRRDWEKARREGADGMSTDKASLLTRVRAADDSFVWCNVHFALHDGPDGQPDRLVGLLCSIDSVKRQADIFKARSEKDALTGCYNKGAAIQMVTEAMTHNYKTPHAMFALDIDNFKQINDTLGHMAGDAVLAETAERLRAIFRSDDVMGRIGGDEFMVLVSGIDERGHVEKKAREIVAAFHTMSINAGGALNLSISIGIDIPLRAPAGYDELFRRADKALYEAKRQGKNCFVFYDTMPEESFLYTVDAQP